MKLASLTLSIAVLAFGCFDDSSTDESHINSGMCGAIDEPCCVDGPNQIHCDDGLFCDATSNGNVCHAVPPPPPPSCGGVGQSCCNGACNAGLVCESACQGGQCTSWCADPTPPPPPPPACGTQGQVCCNGYLCNQGLSCANGTCQ